MFTKKLSLLVLPLITTLSLQASDSFNAPFFQDPFGDNIFKEMMQMQKNMDKMFERMHHRMQQRSSGTVSPLGTYKVAIQNQLVDKGDHYELITNIPESKENHIDINTQNGMLSITAKIIREEENKTAGMVRKSSSVQMYQQALSLPNDVDASTLKAAYENGKLVINIDKKKVSAKTSTLLINGKKQSTQTLKKETIEKTVPKKDNNTTIKKEVIHSDKSSMI